MAHHRPVRLTAHDDPDNRYFRIHDLSEFTDFMENSLEQTEAFTITKPDKGDVKGLVRVGKDTFSHIRQKLGRIFAFVICLWY